MYISMFTYIYNPIESFRIIYNHVCTYIYISSNIYIYMCVYHIYIYTYIHTYIYIYIIYYIYIYENNMLGLFPDVHVPYKHVRCKPYV